MQKRVSHFFEYLALRLLQGLVSILPRQIALRIGAAMGTLLYWSGAYRTIVQKNMDLVGLWTPVQVKAITKKLYRNMGRYAFDFLRSNRSQPLYRTHNFELVEAMQKKGKGTIVLLAHFGNWEILADLFGSRVRNLNVVAKPMKNPLVDRWLARKRQKTRVTTIYMKNALRRIYSALRNNELVAALIDQHAGSGQGTPIPFLGKETATVRTVAGLVHKTGCAIMPVYAIMQEDGLYDIVIAAAEPPDLSGKTDDERITAYQRQHNNIISQWIRQYPEHWFGWFHKRFREHVKYGKSFKK